MYGTYNDMMDEQDREAYEQAEWDESKKYRELTRGR